MLYQQNILLQPVRNLIVPEDQLQKVDDIIKEARATQSYLRRLIKKCFSLMHPRYWLNYYLLKRHFSLFVMGLLSQKQQKVKLCFKKNCIYRLKSYRDKKNKERQRVKQYYDKINIGKLRQKLKQWKKIAQLQTATKSVQKSKFKSSCNEFMGLLIENHRMIERKQLEMASEIISLHDIYCQKIVKQAFQNLKINTNVQRLKKKLISKYFKIFKMNMKQQNKQDLIRSLSFFKKNILSKCFLLWKEQCQMQIAVKFHTQTLMMNYFDIWKHQLPYLQSERQIQQSNEVIIKIYLEKRQLKLRDQSFRRWRQLAVYHKQLSHHNVILNKFAQKQYRYVLLHKYFEKIKLNCLNNKVKLKYYQTKLKRKTLDGFKIYFSKSIEKEGIILDHIDRNLVKKYFNKIKFFNTSQQSKVKTFKLKRIFNRFTTIIISEYCNKIDKADQFKKLNLLFKTLFCLKKARLQKKQQTYAIVLVNIILPLRRWHRKFRIQRYLNEKHWFLKKSILREWRMRVISKDSEKKIVREFNEIESAQKTVNSEEKLEMFQFENIMATIAQIRNNIYSQKDEQQSKEGWYRGKLKSQKVHTPSQSINFSYSLEQCE